MFTRKRSSERRQKIKMNEAYIPAANDGIDFFFLFSILEYDYIPIIFIAKDRQGALYFCDCVECRGVQQWTIAKTTAKTVGKVIDKEITVYDALRSNGDNVIIATYDYATETYSQKKALFSDLTDEDLPDKDSYVSFLAPYAREEYAQLINDASETTYFSFSQPKQIDQWWTSVLNSESSESDVHLAFVLNSAGEKPGNNSGGCRSTNAAFRFIDLATEIRTSLVFSQGQKNHIYDDKRPDSPIAA